MKFILGCLCILGAVLLAQSENDCLRACPFNYDPVCGSDGVTYGNECAFQAAACEYLKKTTDGSVLKMVKRGEC